MENITIGQIGIVIAFFVALIKGVEYLIQPFTKQAKKLDELQEQMTESIQDRKDLHDFMRVNFIAIKELLKHEIEGGNNKAGMKMASDEIDKYLSKKI